MGVEVGLKTFLFFFQTRFQLSSLHFQSEMQLWTHQSCISQHFQFVGRPRRVSRRSLWPGQPPRQLQLHSSIPCMATQKRIHLPWPQTNLRIKVCETMTCDMIMVWINQQSVDMKRPTIWYFMRPPKLEVNRCRLFCEKSLDVERCDRVTNL